jgi:murein DD-endopeptidase MepM/ murein hydrolase activator NlpD
LLIPVAGVSAAQLYRSFDDARSDGRTHHAIDIRAAEGTAVFATADGKLKLHSSERGGIMIYQLDSAGPFVYHYGHLQRYAAGIDDGKTVHRGEVIGYVGDTGNAGPGNFHLHFGIAKMSAPGKWSGGGPIDPFPLLRD